MERRSGRAFQDHAADSDRELLLGPGEPGRPHQQQSLLRAVVPRALAFVLGVLSVGLALSPGSEPHELKASSLQQFDRSLARQYESPSQILGSKRAYVMMAYDRPGEPKDYLMGALALARALQRMSSYPVLLLTNATRFPDGSYVKESFESLDVTVLPLERVEMPGKPGWSEGPDAKESERYDIAWWKLQIFKQTSYEKLIWLDTDAIIYRSLDWLFDREGMWAQSDNWECHEGGDGISTGVLLLEPSEKDFDGLMELANGTMGDLKRGDQELIEKYFQQQGRKIQPLGDLEAGYGQCLGKAKSPYLNADKTVVRGSWSTQAFVHKSGGSTLSFGGFDYANVCFMPNITKQRYHVGESHINICHFHPLGSYWRDLFCEAVMTIGLQMPAISTFCDNECYFHGGQGDGKPCPGAEAAMRGSHAKECESQGQVGCGGPLNGTISYHDYFAKTKGKPELQELSE